MGPKPRTRAIVTWTLSVLLALLFLVSGTGKLLNLEATGGLRFDEQFEAWGYPAWVRLPVGLAEVVGALLLLVPLARPYSAAGLTGVMAGAVATHLRVDEAAAAPIPLLLGVLTGALAWLTRPAWLRERIAARRARRARTQVA